MNTSIEHQLPPGLIARFMAEAQRLQLAKGQELFCLGSAPQAMFGVISGRVQVSVFSAQGRRFLAAQLSKDHWFGEVPLIDDGARAFHVEAVEPTEIAVLSSSAFWDIVNSDAGALLAVTRLICTRYRAALGWIEDACLKPFPARLATRILDLATDAKETDNEVSLSQEALSFQLGVARQTVNKQLKLWERQGLLKLQYGSIKIRDLPAMHCLASPTNEVDR